VGRAGLVAGALLLAGCSPVYVTRSAVGHAKLSWNRKPLPADSVALKARRYAVDVVGLKDGRDYRTWSPVDGDAVTYLVYACPKDSLKAHQFWFPFIGSFPYKGFFSPLQAKAEAQKWEKKGLDAVIVPVAAYNTPLPWGDPLPEPVLRWGEGDLAELVIHELVHGTVYFRNQTGFNEALASWLAERAVEGYLSGKALEEWTEGRDAGERRAKLVEELTAKLKAVYEAKGSNGRSRKPRPARSACASPSTTPSSSPTPPTAASRNSSTRSGRRTAATGRRRSPRSRRWTRRTRGRRCAPP
jgi:predicted aminopeptidase